MVGIAKFISIIAIIWLVVTVILPVFGALFVSVTALKCKLSPIQDEQLSDIVDEPKGDTHD